MALLLADENFPMPAVVLLRQHGHDVQTLLQLGLAGQAIPDEDVLMLATSSGRCVLTLNRRDFIKLHNQIPAHAGVIICTVQPDFTILASLVDACIIEHNQALAGQLLRVQRLS